MGTMKHHKRKNSGYHFFPENHIAFTHLYFDNVAKNVLNKCGFNVGIPSATLTQPQIDQPFLEHSLFARLVFQSHYF